MSRPVSGVFLYFLFQERTVSNGSFRIEEKSHVRDILVVSINLPYVFESMQFDVLMGLKVTCLHHDPPKGLQKRDPF